MYEKFNNTHKIHESLNKASKGKAKSQILNADKKLKLWHYKPTVSLGPLVEVRLQSLSTCSIRR
jgi:hypothetical protein